MKKNIQKFLSMLLAVMMLALTVFGGSEPVQGAAMSKTKQHALYSKTMKQYASKVKASFRKNTQGMDIYKDNPRKVLYAFADIDKNGIDELIMKYDNPKEVKTTVQNGSLWEQSTTIYTIKKGKVVTVLNNTNVNPNNGRQLRVRIYKNRNRINMALPVGYEQHEFYIYSNGRINKKSGKISMSHGISYGRHQYSYNNRRISGSSYKKKYKALTNNERGYAMRLCKYQ